MGLAVRDMRFELSRYFLEWNRVHGGLLMAWLVALAMALATPVRANPEMGTLAIAQSWNGEIAEAVEARALEDVQRGWQPYRQLGRAAALVSAVWPVIVGGEAKKLTTELRYDVASDNSVSRGIVLGAWWGYPVVFRCQSGRQECYSVDLEAGEVTFRNAIVPGDAELKIPGLRLSGVWRVRLHLDRDGKEFKPSTSNKNVRGKQ
jgi:hypothetical protein